MCDSFMIVTLNGEVTLIVIFFFHRVGRSGELSVRCDVLLYRS